MRPVDTEPRRRGDQRGHLRPVAQDREGRRRQARERRDDELEALARRDAAGPDEVDPIGRIGPLTRAGIQDLAILDEARDDSAAGDDVATDDDPVPAARQPADAVVDRADRDGRRPVRRGSALARRHGSGAPGDEAEPRQIAGPGEPGRQRRIRGWDADPCEIRAAERLPQDRCVPPHDRRHRPKVAGDPVERRRGDDSEAGVDGRPRRRTIAGRTGAQRMISSIGPPGTSSRAARKMSNVDDTG